MIRLFYSVLLLALMVGATLPVYAEDDEAIEITVAMTNPTNLDPVSLSRFDLAGRDLVENLFVGLTRLNTRTGQIEPWLAESWTVSQDGLVWTFQLRDDIQWVRQDLVSGEPVALRPVVADDVVYAVQRACDPKRPSPVAANLYLIAGCRNLATTNSLESLPLETVQIKALDATTLEIGLVFPASYFLTVTSLPEMRPLPSEYIDDNLGGWFNPANAITSGAWMIQDWVVNEALQLTPNPFWTGEKTGNLTAVNVRFNIPFDTLGNELAAGTVDVARLDPLLVQNDPRLEPIVKSYDGQTLILLGFSFNNFDIDYLPIPSPLDNPALRRALALSLDRETLIQTVYGIRAEAADHFTPSSALAAPSSRGASFDVVAAQAALAEAGYPNCAGLPALPIVISSDPTDLTLAQNMVVQWQTNLGCPVETFPLIQTTRAGVLESARKAVDVQNPEAVNYPLWLIKWSADYPDAQGWTNDALHCEDGYFRTGRICGGTDEVMDQAGLNLDITARFTAYNQIETDLFGSQGLFPVIPLGIEQAFWTQPEWLAGVPSYGTWQFDRWIVDVEERGAAN